MTKLSPSVITPLLHQFEATDEKEIYQQLEKTRVYRIGVGVRREAAGSPSFFFELTLQLATENGTVDLHRLETALALLQALHAQGYTLSFQDGSTSISCEKLLTQQMLFHEYATLQRLIKQQQGTPQTPR